MIRKIGALWITKGKDGNYLSGQLQDLRGDIRIGVFKNTKKEKQNQPDYNIVVMTNDDRVKSDEPEAEEEDTAEDLPF